MKHLYSSAEIDLPKEFDFTESDDMIDGDDDKCEWNEEDKWNDLGLEQFTNSGENPQEGEIICRLDGSSDVFFPEYDYAVESDMMSISATNSMHLCANNSIIF